MSVKQLYLRVGDKVRGPFEVAQVREAARQGKVLPVHEASADGQTWFKLETNWTQLTCPSTGDPKTEPKAGAAPPSSPPRPVAQARVGAAANMPQSPSNGSPATAESPPAGASAEGDASMFEETEAPVRPKRRPVSESLDREPGAPPPNRQSPQSSSQRQPGALPAPRPNPPPFPAAPPPHAPAYSADAYRVLRIVLAFAGAAYLLLGISGVVLAVGFRIETLSGWFAVLFGLVMLFGRMLSSASVLLDLIAGVVLLLWAKGVCRRLRVYHPKYLRKDFFDWAVCYFVPILSLFTIAGMQTRLWHASVAGHRSPDPSESKPDNVKEGMIVRGLIWVSYAVLLAVAFWIWQLGNDAAEIESKAQAAVRSTPRSATQSMVSTTQQASQNMAQVQKSARTAAMIFGVVLAVYGFGSFAVVRYNATFARFVHDNMLSEQNADA